MIVCKKINCKFYNSKNKWCSLLKINPHNQKNKKMEYCIKYNEYPAVLDEKGNPVMPLTKKESLELGQYIDLLNKILK